MALVDAALVDMQHINAALFEQSLGDQVHPVALLWAALGAHQSEAMTEGQGFLQAAAMGQWRTVGCVRGNGHRLQVLRCEIPNSG